MLILFISLFYIHIPYTSIMYAESDSELHSFWIIPVVFDHKLTNVLFAIPTVIHEHHLHNTFIRNS